MEQPAHTPYFFLSLIGAVALAVLFGVALPTLTSRILREVTWARPRRLVKMFVYWWLGAIAAAWAFDAYCQWFGLVNYMSVMVFLWAIVLALATVLGFRHYRKLNFVTTRAYLEQERMLFNMMQDVSQAGFIISEPAPNDEYGWRIKWANRAACHALGYEFLRNDKNEMVGLSGARIVVPEMAGKASEFAGSPGKSDYFLQLQTKQGGVQWVDVAGQTMNDYHGGPLRVTYFNVVTKLIEQVQDKRDTMLVKRLAERFDQVFPPSQLVPA